jgi:hypothetical protein
LLNTSRNSWFRRNLVVRARSREGRESNPLQTVDRRPGKPPESELDGGQGNEGSQGFSKSLARRRFRPNQRRCARPPSGAARRRSLSCRRSA